MSNEIKQILNDFRWRNSYKLFFNNIYRFDYTELFGLQKKWEIFGSILPISFNNNFLFVLFYCYFCWT